MVKVPMMLAEMSYTADKGEHSFEKHQLKEKAA